MAVLNLDFSPVKGPEGNIEYLLYIQKADASAAADQAPPAVDIEAVVKNAHEALDKTHG